MVSLGLSTLGGCVLTFDRAPVNILAWQLIGAAMFVPLYLMIELEQQLFPRKQGMWQDPTVPYLQAKALIPASTVTILHLYRMVYFPPSGTTSSQHQTLMAIWQGAPFLFYCAIATIVLYLSPKNPTQKDPTPSRNADKSWVKATIALYGLFSAAMHIGVLWELMFTKDLLVSHESTFLPMHQKLKLPNAGDVVFDEERKYFLQWDYIIVLVGAAVYVTAILDRINSGFGRMKQLVVFIVAVLASHVVSFGLVCAIVLYIREDFLRSRVAVEKKDENHSKIPW